MEKERYIVKYDPDFVNVFGVSPVEDPANGYHFMCFSNESKSNAITNLAKDGKRIVTGVILVPDQKIDRLNSISKKLYTIEFPKEVIEKFSRDFFVGGYNANAWENHDRTKPINGFTYFENWVVVDSNNDKSNALGFNVPAGTWLMSAYVEDDAIWQQCLDGTFKGFSIDSIIDFVKIDENQQNFNNNVINKKDEKMGLLKKIISIFSEEVKLASQTVEGIGELTADSFEIGQLVVGPDMQPLVSAEWVSEGVKFKTDETGHIIEAEKEEESMDMPAQEAEAAPAEDSTELAEYVFDQMVLPEGLAIGDILKIDNGNGPELYVNADFEMDGKHVMTDENGMVTVYEDVQAQDVQETLPTTSLSNSSEKLMEFETSNGNKIYVGWLTFGQVVTNEAQEVLVDTVFEIDGLFYETDVNGEIFKTEKNYKSPFWSVETPKKSETPEMVEMKKKMEMLQSQIELLQRTNMELKTKVDVMSKAPAADKAKANNKTVLSKEDLNKMTPLERYRYYKNN